MMKLSGLISIGIYNSLPLAGHCKCPYRSRTHILSTTKRVSEAIALRVEAIQSGALFFAAAKRGLRNPCHPVRSFFKSFAQSRLLSLLIIMIGIK